MASVGLSPVGQNSAVLLIILYVLSYWPVSQSGWLGSVWSIDIEQVTWYIMPQFSKRLLQNCDRHSPKSPLLLCSFEDTQCINHFLAFKIAMHNWELQQPNKSLPSQFACNRVAKKFPATHLHPTQSLYQNSKLMQQWLLTTTLLRRSKLVLVLRELCIERYLLISSAFEVTSVTWDIKACEIISTRRGWTQSSDGTGNASVERDGHHSLWQTLQEDLVEIWSQQGHATYLRGVEALHWSLGRRLPSTFTTVVRLLRWWMFRNLVQSKRLRWTTSRVHHTIWSRYVRKVQLTSLTVTP